ncbi:multidrug efflux SMR transporter [Amylibacter sp. SFDW26]|uniref:DMT family transporter n=1 Tax=Amylibacter sp. SFDW26 TaxID=2652722 RepID=UPI00126298FD|nr:multidrug efflux SMR transporter [Amylibacter sp. SFDW26]KAB7615660.1 multidrug efflux SMR transporter [Amylibacter sp. SFDW26]
MPVHYIYLIIAVVCETAGTACIKASAEFTKPLPSIGVLICFGAAFYFLSLTLKYMPIGVVYALWSGLGIVLITIIGIVIFKQSLDLAAYIGIGLIMLGVIVINVFSNSTPH